MSEAGVSGGTLREWRESRGWDVLRMARELVKAADEPLASLDGLTHMINAWERDARPPSPRYRLLYLRIFRPRPNGTHPGGGGMAAAALREAGKFQARADDALKAAARRPPGGPHDAEVREMTSALRVIQEQVDVIARRLAGLAGGEDPGAGP